MHLNQSRDTLNSPIILSNKLQAYNLSRKHHGSTESRKILEQKFVFHIGTLNHDTFHSFIHSEEGITLERPTGKQLLDSELDFGQDLNWT